MEVQFHTDLQTFADQVRPFLLQDEADNNVMLGMLHRRLSALRKGQQLDKNEPPLFCSVVGNGEVIGAASQTPPYSLNLTRMPSAAIDAVVYALAERAVHLYGAHGHSEISGTFAAAWIARRGVVITRRKPLLFYKLCALLSPEATAGHAHLATQDDVDLLRNWERAFADELDLPTPEDKAEIENRIATKTSFVWRTSSPVATAGFRHITGTCARIIGVYVPPEQRRRGYASAVVHAVTRHALDLGLRNVFLFTDAEDEAPNIVYTRLGYVRVGEYTDYRFGDASHLQ